MNSNEKHSMRLGLVFWLLCLFSSFGATTGVAGKSLVLGFADGIPVIYFSPQEGMSVQIMDITYNTSGQVAAYDMEILYPFGEKFSVTIKPGSATTKQSTAYRYKALINGKEQMSIPLSKWKHTKTKNIISFYPEGKGGSIFRFKERLEQKNFLVQIKNQSIIRESFSCEGIYYEFEYSEHLRNESGQLLGYRATIISLQKKVTEINGTMVKVQTLSESTGVGKVKFEAGNESGTLKVTVSGTIKEVLDGYKACYFCVESISISPNVKIPTEIFLDRNIYDYGIEIKTLRQSNLSHEYEREYDNNIKLNVIKKIKINGILRGYIKSVNIDAMFGIAVNPNATEFIVAGPKGATLRKKGKGLLLLEGKAYILRTEEWKPRKEIEGEESTSSISEDFDKVIVTKKQERVRISVILIKDYSDADEVLKKLNAGEDFSQLCQQHSIGPEKEKGGDIGYIAPDDLMEPLSIEAFKLKVGQYSRTIKTDRGYFILMKTE